MWFRAHHEQLVGAFCQLHPSVKGFTNDGTTPVAGHSAKCEILSSLAGLEQLELQGQIGALDEIDLLSNLLTRDVDGSLELPLLVEPRTERGEKAFLHTRVYPG